MRRTVWTVRVFFLVVVVVAYMLRFWCVACVGFVVVVVVVVVVVFQTQETHKFPRSMSQVFSLWILAITEHALFRIHIGYFSFLNSSNFAHPLVYMAAESLAIFCTFCRHACNNALFCCRAA